MNYKLKQFAFLISTTLLFNSIAFINVAANEKSTTIAYDEAVSPSSIDNIALANNELNLSETEIPYNDDSNYVTFKKTKYNYIAQKDLSCYFYKFTPKDAVESGTYLTIELEKGEFAENVKEISRYNAFDKGNYDWENVLNKMLAGYSFNQLYNRFMYNRDSNEMPYGVVYADSKKITVELMPISDGYVNRDLSHEQLCQGIPSFFIPIYVKNELDDVSFKVSSNHGNCNGFTFDSSQPRYKNGSVYSKSHTNSYNETVDSIYYLPYEEVCKGDRIKLELNNAIYSQTDIEKMKSKNTFWDDFWKYIDAGATMKQAYNKFVYHQNTSELPYNIADYDSKTVEIELTPILDIYTHRNNASAQLTLGEPIFNFDTYFTQINQDLPVEVNIYYLTNGESYKLNTLRLTNFDYVSLKADVNSDGVVNRADYVLASKFFAGNPVDINNYNTDVNRDDNVTRADYVIIAKYFAGVKTEYTIP